MKFHEISFHVKFQGLASNFATAFLPSSPPVAQHCVQILRRPELGSLAPEPGLTHFGPTVRAVPYRVEPLHHGADRHGLDPHYGAAPWTQTAPRALWAGTAAARPLFPVRRYRYCHDSRP